MVTSVSSDTEILPDQSKISNQSDIPDTEIDLRETGEQPMQE
jgi:hypothetical protein